MFKELKDIGDDPSGSPLQSSATRRCCETIWQRKWRARREIKHRVKEYMSLTTDGSDSVGAAWAFPLRNFRDSVPAIFELRPRQESGLVNLNS